MTSPFFYNFTDKATTEELIANGTVAKEAKNTQFSYSEEQKALRVAPINFDEKTSNAFILRAPKGLSVPEYPVVAFKIKYNNPSDKLDVMAGTITRYSSQFLAHIILDSYDNTTDWQVMVFDGKDHEKIHDAYSGLWSGLLFFLRDFNTCPTEKDEVFIEWAGVFATADEAYAYSGMENPVPPYCVPDPDKKAPTDFFWDLTKKEVAAAHVIAADGGVASFDEKEKALKLTVTDANKKGIPTITPGRFTLGVRNALESFPAAEKTPLLALRVKRGRGDMPGGWLSFRTTRVIEKYDATELNSADYAAGRLTYQAGTDWQTLVVDASKLAAVTDAFAGDLMTAKIDVADYTATEDGDEMWVRWFGAFASIEDIEAYVRATEGVDASIAVMEPDLEAVADKNFTTGDITETIDGKLDPKWDNVFPVTPKMTTAEAAALIDNSKAIATATKIKSDVALVSDYEPEYGYKHHANFTYFKGKYYASYSRGLVGEDAPGQCMMLKSSEDGLTWSEPIVIGPSVDTGFGWSGSIAGFLFVADGRLYATYTELHFGPENYRQDGSWIRTIVHYRKTFNRITYTEDGIHWSRPERISVDSNETPRESLTGRWFAGAGHLMMTANTPTGRNWRLTGMTREQNQSARDKGALLTESSWYQTDDLVLHQMIRSDTGLLWLCESYDNGDTWTTPEPSKFTSSVTMPYFGRLPDGRIFFVGGTDPLRRYPLALQISEDGYHFDKGYILRDELYQMQDSGFGKSGEFAYPEVYIHGDYLFVHYSKEKEVMEVTRVKLSDIK